MLNLLILAAGVAAIAWVNWYFFMAPKAAVSARTEASGVQQVGITVEGGYSPSVVRVRKGAPQHTRQCGFQAHATRGKRR